VLSQPSVRVKTQIFDSSCGIRVPFNSTGGQVPGLKAKVMCTDLVSALILHRFSHSLNRSKCICSIRDASMGSHEMLVLLCHRRR
jgi:hypothetical protein